MARNSFGYPADQGFSGSEGLQAEHSQLLGRRGPRFDRSQPASGVESFRGPGAPPDEGPQESPRQRFLNELTARNQGLSPRGASPNSTLAMKERAQQDPTFAAAQASNLYGQAKAAGRQADRAEEAPAPASQIGGGTASVTMPGGQTVTRTFEKRERPQSEIDQVMKNRQGYIQDHLDKREDLRDTADSMMMPQTGSPSFSADRAVYPQEVQNRLDMEKAQTHAVETGAQNAAATQKQFTQLQTQQRAAATTQQAADDRKASREQGQQQFEDRQKQSQEQFEAQQKRLMDEAGMRSEGSPAARRQKIIDHATDIYTKGGAGSMKEAVQTAWDAHAFLDSLEAKGHGALPQGVAAPATQPGSAPTANAPATKGPVTQPSQPQQGQASATSQPQSAPKIPQAAIDAATRAGGKVDLATGKMIKDGWEYSMADGHWQPDHPLAQ
jgi:hypothetical protein